MGTGCRAFILTVALVAVVAGGAEAAEKSRAVTVTGRIVDTVCWLPAGQKGEAHRECAIGCDKAGVRMALLDEKANQLYMLMADKPFVDPNAAIREHLERVVTVTGDLFEVAGAKVLAVKEVKAAAANPCAAQNPCAPKNPCAAR
jgi:hypothetical protein